jgi:ferredoxin
MQGGRAVHYGGMFGIGTGEGPSVGDCAVHKVKIINHYSDQVVEVEVPEDRWVM